MSDERQAGHWQSPCPHPEAVGTRWGDPISAERQAELKALADRQREWAAQPEATRGDSHFGGVKLSGADVAWLVEASEPPLHLERAFLQGAHLEGARLHEAHLEGALLDGAHLEGAYLRKAHLEGAILWDAHLERANLHDAHLDGADLRGAFLDTATILRDATLSRVQVTDTRWGGVNLANISGMLAPPLEDESVARDWKSRSLKMRQGESQSNHAERFAHRRLQAAVRANRQLAVALRDQGLNEEADRFAYRAQFLQRQVLRRQGKPFRALFSWFLDMLAGHGYKPERTLVAYLIAILGFGTVYCFLGQAVGPHLSPLGAFVFSMTSFHGRGSFPGGIALDDPITVLAAFEAFVGLVIEVSFIATFTQRFFAR